MEEAKKSTTVKKTPAKKVATTKSTKTVKTTISKNELPEVKKTSSTTKVAVDVKLPSTVFGLKQIYTQAIFDAILSERASRRFSTHKTKSRGEVSGSGKKPWRQKGTGNARAGSLRSPIFVGGGKVFGPTTARNYNLKINKKARKNALFSALTLLANDKAVMVKEYNLTAPKTKELLMQLAQDNLALLNYVLIVSDNENVFKSANNLPNVHVTKVTSLSVEQLIAADVIVMSEKDVKYLEGMAK
ncbi:50S ribosomal protein L4 [Metamycoplasma cloacale]|uniref:Large ribosomal subunit protein uL4 n=1 Tax=Metamycoplasma cloacale TaxID=92401 RepID=A0A2Z4LMP1_9BACT|nr:50S ribosomal protein L4 [Metamycoplasma cloacale]AWX42698.1 50S ribosomal protein L4 [Metamycoplasma cloacale]VEU79490.1 50S ribosomal protein L4 [Metamycoplasma cloacale]